MINFKWIVAILIAMYLIFNIRLNVPDLIRSKKVKLKAITMGDGHNSRTLFEDKKGIGTEAFLINTPGCSIQDYSKTLKFYEAANKHRTCGQRAIFIEKISNMIIRFNIDKEKLATYRTNISKIICCYRFARRHKYKGKEDTEIIYTPCVKFSNGTKVELEQEVLTVSCVLRSSKPAKTIYNDAYLILKEINITDKMKTAHSWNVLMIGMDTMSRARVFRSMPLTVQYMQRNKWLDYRGYQKVAYNTFPNLMALLSAKNISTVYKACTKGIYECNHLLIWSKFRDAGYITAYGEDYIRLPDTFYRYKGFRIPPTDHYTRPFFLTGENHAGNLICVGKLPSALHLLDYAYHFSNAYKNANFFGLFWLNSFSHNEDNLPTLIDKDIPAFFEKLRLTAVLNNTVVFFFSDHGIRFGKTRLTVESFYEERLPMHFIWIPKIFQELYQREYKNLEINQNRLTTPYDVHLTLWDILRKTNSSVDIVRPEACPQCVSLFEAISEYRKCSDASVSQRWCSCQNLTSVTDTAADHSLQLAVTHIQNLTKTIETLACKVCSPLKLKSVLRKHSYISGIDDKTYYVVAFVMMPGNLHFEVTVEKDDSHYTILEPVYSISAYNTRGSCVKKSNYREYCVCNVLKKCRIGRG